jgi:hypothetical protein
MLARIRNEHTSQRNPSRTKGIGNRAVLTCRPEVLDPFFLRFGTGLYLS